MVVVPVKRPLPIAMAIAPHRPPDRLPWRHRARGGLPLGLQARDDGLNLAGQQRLQVGAAPRRALRMGLPQQGVDRVPPRLRGMHDVQDHGVRRNVGHHLLWQGLGAIGARDALLPVGPIALGDPLRQTAHGLCHTGLEGLETERHPQDAFEHGLALAGGFVGRPVDRPLAQPVGIAVCRHAQLGVEGAEALVPRGREGMPPKAHLAKHRPRRYLTACRSEQWRSRSAGPIAAPGL